MNPSRTALACPYCRAPLHLKLFDFNPTQRVVLCPACFRGLRLPGPLRFWGLCTLVLVMAAEIVFLKGLGEPDDFVGIALKAALFLGVVLSSSLVASLVCRMMATSLVGVTGYAARGAASPPASPIASSSTSPSLILLLVAGLNHLLYIGTLTAAMASGERLSPLERYDSPYVLAYKGIYVKVSPDVHFWIRVHGWVTIALIFLAVVAVYYGMFRERRTPIEPPP